MAYRGPMGEYTRHGGVDFADHSEGLASRRAKLSMKQKSWKQDVEDDPDLYSMLGEDYYDLNTAPSPLELTMLHKSLTIPGLPPEEADASPKQLIQLLHSPDPAIGLFSLKRIAAKMEAGEMAINHLSLAVKPMVHIVLRGDRDEELHWAVLFVLQQLCLDDKHAMSIGDIGGTRALILLIDGNQKPGPRVETVNHDALTNILNAIWLICCYEGNGDLSSYNERDGPIVSMLNLLTALNEDGALTARDSRPTMAEHLRQDYMGWEAERDELAGEDPVFVLLTALSRVSALKTCRGQITAAGGIEACVPLMQHVRMANRIAAVGVVQNLMVDNSLEFVIIGGVPVVLAMLAAPAEEEYMHALRMCLHLFAVRGDLQSMATDMVSCGALAVCADLIQSHNQEAARGALALLSLLCKHGVEDYSYLLCQEKRMVEATAELLRDTHVPTLQQATAMFWYLTRVLADAAHTSSVVTSSIPVLKRLLSTAADPVIHHNVIGCLTKLECFDDLSEDVFSPAPTLPTIQW
ncbi:hypothetical protein DIPPA_32723 [Diplonema papillatum]|nr:hypothetical protein DIPPA_32723 [Diplonema papillatum]